jgi:hypothetical protein
VAMVKSFPDPGLGWGISARRPGSRGIVNRNDS